MEEIGNTCVVVHEKEHAMHVLFAHAAVGRELNRIPKGMHLLTHSLADVVGAKAAAQDSSIVYHDVVSVVLYLDHVYARTGD